MENVARLYNHNRGKTRKEILEVFEPMGYLVDCKILNSADYGVAQIRKRVIFIGSSENKTVCFPEKEVEKYITVKKVLEKCPIPEVIYGTEKYQTALDFGSQTTSLEQSKTLSIQELAELQSFPADFEFLGTSISQQQQVGNAVPPKMAEAIARTILKLKENTHKYPKVNYIGNKEQIASWICDKFPEDAKTIFDAFSGGCSLAFEAKKRGYEVYTNDILQVNFQLAKGLIENKNIKLDEKDIEMIFSGKAFEGFMFENYANVFFFPEECKELDLYRENINKLDSEYKQALALALMRRAMIRKMPYSRFNLNWEKIKQLRDEEYSYQKYKRKRAYHNQSFQFHFLENLEEYNEAVFDNGQTHKAYNEDVFDILEHVEADIIYLDPPYTGTMNDYFGFYALLDNYIVSKKKTKFDHSFTHKKTVGTLFNKLFSKLSNFKYCYLSYNNSSFPSQRATFGNFRTICHRY